MKKIIEKLDNIRAIAVNWTEGNVPLIEKDIILGEIQDLYRELKTIRTSEKNAAGFTSTETTAGLTDTVPAREVAAASEACAPADISPRTGFSATGREDFKTPTVGFEKNAEAVSAPRETEVSTPVSFETTNGIQAPDFTAATDPGYPYVESTMAAGSFAPSVSSEVAPGESSRDQNPDGTETVTDETLTTPRTKVDKKKILSLYDDDMVGSDSSRLNSTSAQAVPAEKSATFTDPVSTSATDTRQAVKTERADAPPVSHLQAVNDLAAGTTPVLGDVINSGEKTLSDIYSENSGADMADKIVADTTTGIRQAIGLNDKFMLIRELFNGDAALYDAAIDRLESFNELEEALLFIHENFDWNPNGDGAKYIVELLSRKLS